MNIREQVLDVLANTGPQTMTNLVRILEEFDCTNAMSRGGVHPVKSTILEMLNAQELILTPDRYLILPLLP